MKKVCVFLMVIGLMMAIQAQEKQTQTMGPNIETSCERLCSVMKVLKSGGDITVTALGGSITTGYAATSPLQKGWAGLVGFWFQEKAKESGGKVIYYNAGVSGTDSAFAAARLEDHILKKNVDLVFLEFAMNDQWLSARVRKRSYEGIIRAMLKDSNRAILALFLNEKLPPYRSNQSEQEIICKHYSIPFVSWKDCLQKEYSDVPWNTFFTGSEAIHPNDSGHSSIAQYIIAKLETVWNSIDTKVLLSDPPSASDTLSTVTLPVALTDADFEHVQCLNSNTIEPDGNIGWETGSPVHDDWRRIGSVTQGWSTTDPEAEMSFKIRGKSIGIMIAQSNLFRNAEAWIEYEDGSTSRPKALNCYSAGNKAYLGWYYQEIIHGDTVENYILHVGVKKSRSTDAGKSTNILGILVNGIGE